MFKNSSQVRQVLTPGIRAFFVLWTGQVVSLVGSGLTAFALGVWVYQQNGSVTQFALISFFTQLPGIVIAPIAGALVDRWNRRWAMIFSDTGAAVCTLAIAILFLTHHLQIWQIYLATGLMSLFSAFQWPAYLAATTLLVPKEQLGRANGLLQLGEAAAQLVSPILAGVLLATIRLEGIILFDLMSFLVALGALLLIRIADTGERTVRESHLGQEISQGWNYLKSRRGLVELLILLAADNLLLGIVSVLVTPLVLSFTSAQVLGTIMSIGGIGMLVGSLLMASWGGPRWLIHGVLAFNFLSGLSIFAAGWYADAPFLAFCAFLFFFNVPLINGCDQAIWQRKVSPEIQGRVFAVKRSIAWSCLPIAYVVAGPLADRVFEPLLAPDGLLADSIGQIIGVGEGRGIGLMFILLGLLTMLVVGIASQSPRLRWVEKELPDALGEPQ